MCDRHKRRACPTTQPLCGKEDYLEIEILKGFQLESVSFGVAFYTLVFDGEINGKPRTYHVGTNYNLSDSIDKLGDVGEEVSKLLWGFLGNTLEKVTTSENEKINSITFFFENGGSFTIWQESGAVDNLLIVRDPHSEEWFPVI